MPEHMQISRRYLWPLRRRSGPGAPSPSRRRSTAAGAGCLATSSATRWAGELLVTTWAVAGTGVKWDESSKTITLTSDDAYEGEITFLG